MDGWTDGRLTRAPRAPRCAPLRPVRPVRPVCKSPGFAHGSQKSCAKRAVSRTGFEACAQKAGVCAPHSFSKSFRAQKPVSCARKSKTVRKKATFVHRIPQQSRSEIPPYLFRIRKGADSAFFAPYQTTLECWKALRGRWQIRKGADSAIFAVNGIQKCSVFGN